MAGLSTPELDRIHRQIREFPAGDSDGSDVEMTDKLESRGNLGCHGDGTAEKEAAQLSEELKLLEAEIEDLEGSIQTELEEGRKQECWRNVRRTKTKVLEDPDVSAQLQSQLEVFEDITGVTLSHSYSSILEEGPEMFVRKRVISGSSSDVDFKLEMEVEESMTSDLTATGTVRNLSVWTSENFSKILSSDIERLVEQCDVQGFLRLLLTYGTWREARQTAFNHFTHKYPNIARQTTEQMSLHHPKKKCSFVVKWGFKVSDNNSLLPDIEISMQVPSKVRAAPVVTEAGDNFQLMFKELGIEKTLAALVTQLQQ